MTLEPKDYFQYLKVQLDLFYFVGQKTNLFPPKFAKQDFLETRMTEKFECRQKLYEDDRLVDEYLKEHGSELKDEERDIIEGIKKRISGNFVIFKTLTNYAIFNSMSDNKFYAVKALGDPFTKFF